MSDARYAELPTSRDQPASKRLRPNPPKPPVKQKSRPSLPPPKTEDEWTSSRSQCGLDSPEKILRQLEQLAISEREGRNYDTLEFWQKFIYLAATFVDNEVEANRRLPYIFNGQLPGYHTRRKDAAAVKQLVQFIDGLYPLFKHRAFEFLIILSK